MLLTETQIKGENMRAYIVRHGETLFNTKGLKQGWCDSPLTAKGIEQAIQTGEKLLGIDFEFGYSSTSERAIDTLDLILKDQDIPRKALKGLKEINFGEMEGQSEKYVHKELGYTNDDLVQFGAESRQDACQRFITTLKEISKNHEGNVLIVCHGGIMINLMLELNENLLHSWGKQGHPMPNCTVLVMDIDENSIDFIERL